jgi:hypothetical protein
MKLRVSLVTMACGAALATSHVAAQADSALCSATAGVPRPHLPTSHGWKALGAGMDRLAPRRNFQFDRIQQRAVHQMKIHLERRRLFPGRIEQGDTRSAGDFPPGWHPRWEKTLKVISVVLGLPSTTWGM